jgi:hypothetical protein
MKIAGRIAAAGAIIGLLGLSACVWYDPRMRGYYDHGRGSDRGYGSQYEGRGRGDRGRNWQGDSGGQRGDGRYYGR